MAHRIITINRMYGSGGRLLGKALAEELGIHFYDQELIRLASEENDIPYEELLKVDEKKASQWRLPIKDQMQMQPQYHFHPMNDVLFETQSKIIPYEELLKVDEKKASQWRLPIKDQMQMQPQYHFHPMNDVLFETQSKIIENLAQKEDCIIVGRCANYLLRGKCLSLFVYAPYEYRVHRVMERLGREDRSARALIRKTDKSRKAYYEFFTDEKWNDPENYNFCVD